ncbi:putative murein hydrolase (TIGR00659 family) [Novosphingobium sediminicola]|uniref:Putative murein hydrolase (TIGR00659 family) n=2 Tax=Novosphingobium sediminicola TaxID=563162 RepID=A0A7W6CDS0_9SPHN|nr:putative murein hydrolase (TIGR00659 family) [Novosphingobium sediminicola]
MIDAGSTALWSALTLASFAATRAVHRRRPRWWLMPLITAPLGIALILLVFHVPYATYRAGAGWLLWMLGPAVTAFAVPIYDQRAMIRRYWRPLLAGMIAGSATSFLSGWALASALGIDGPLRLSLLPRSVSTPFAMAISAEIGGMPDITAVFVIATGILGALLGEAAVMRGLPSGRTAQGAMVGVAAHAIGTAQVQSLHPRVGAVAGLAMVLTGLLNLALAPLVLWFLPT